MITSDGKKICAGCGDAKPATLEHFYRCRNGLQARCKPCDNKHRGQARGKGIYGRIARELGVSEVRVHQIEASALRKLRKSKLGKELLRAIAG